MVKYANYYIAVTIFFVVTAFFSSDCFAQKKGEVVWYAEIGVVNDTVVDRSWDVQWLSVDLKREFFNIYNPSIDFYFYNLDGSFADSDGIFEPGFYYAKVFVDLNKSYKGDEYVEFWDSIFVDFRLWPQGSFFVLENIYPSAVLGENVYFKGTHYLYGKIKKRPDFQYTYYLKNSDRDSTILDDGYVFPVGSYKLNALLHDNNDCYADKVFSLDLTISPSSPCSSMEPPRLKVKK